MEEGHTSLKEESDFKNIMDELASVMAELANSMDGLLKEETRVNVQIQPNQLSAFKRKRLQGLFLILSLKLRYNNPHKRRE